MGSFIEMDMETDLLIENFTFYGRMNFHFLSFFESSDILISNLSLFLNGDIHGVVLNELGSF